MNEQPARQLVATSWVVARTGLSRACVKRAAASGRIPGATKLLGEWRFDPQAIEAWIAAGQPNQGTTESARVQAEPARAALAAQPHQGRDAKTDPDASNIPPLVVLFPTAAHRGIHDRPAEQPARSTGQRRARTRKTALPR